ncbi:MAG: acetyl-CoA carboxylase biotin carboxyl carrier protein [Ruminococcus sp.]|nr:acetyl-CoA carboxylase biotin carboxyl carrier protein [Ruminococcus sp.]
MSDKSFYLDTVKELVKLVKDNDLGEITVVADGDKKITIKGKVAVAQAPAAVQTVQPKAEAKAESDEGKQSAASGGKEVKAPIVGTFYAAPSPDSEPYVHVGQTVNKGDTIFIIESMKVMNEVLSEYDGTVKSILVNSGDPVDFDQTVMVIE